MSNEHIEQWIQKGTYVCPGCHWRMSGAAWSLARYSYTCPHCGDYTIREFKRSHK